MSTVSCRLGSLGESLHQQLGEWQQARVVERIWAMDSELWPGETEIVDRLGWLQLPARSIEHVSEMEAFGKELRDENVSDVVLLGMGGSSLAAEVFAESVGPRRGYPNLIVLDSTHPDAVAAVRQRLELDKTVFIVSSKSGGTLETLSLFRYFYHQVGRVSQDPGRHFVAITDPGSSLEELAVERGFRRTFLAPADVGGRYSALSVFGLVPAAVLGVDLRRVLASAHAVAAACACDDANPGLELGAMLAVAGAAGRNKIAFVTTPTMASLPDWIEQLVAESLGKDDKGVLPVVGESFESNPPCADDRLIVAISLEDDEPLGQIPALSRLDDVDCPVMAVRLSDPHDLGGEFFRWEFATAVAGMAMGVHPFNQPDVQLAKEFTKKAMAGEQSGVDVPAIQVDDRQALAKFLEGQSEGDYLVIQAFLAPTRPVRRRLSRLQEQLRRRCGVAVASGFGPRFLHSTGQLHKGGPPNGRFLQLIDRAQGELEIPEAGYGFSSLISAQATGDLAALIDRGRPAARIDLGADAVQALDDLIEVVSTGS